MRYFILALALFATTVGQANSEAKCNKHGAVVTLTDGTVLYLGMNCDAARKGGGTGNWWNAASFLAVKIDGRHYKVAEGAGIDCLPFCESPL